LGADFEEEEEAVEACNRTAELWKDRALVTALIMHRETTPWLADYIASVVRDLEAQLPAPPTSPGLMELSTEFRKFPLPEPSFLAKITLVSRTPKPPERWPGFEIAIEGEGLSPAELPIRTLVELLEAACKVVDSVAIEMGIRLPSPSLVAVRHGSAAYDVRIHDEGARPVVTEVEKHIKTRAQDASPAVRQGVKRLHDAGGRVGSVRFSPYSRSGTRRKPLYVAAPIEIVPAPLDTTDEVQGRVVGVLAGARHSIRLRLDDGRVHEYRVETEDLARKSARLFLKSVRAQIELQVTDGVDTQGMVTSLEECEVPDDDFLSEIEAIRNDVFSEASPIRGSDWLRELDEDR
jgi:hypothetical protein